MKILALVLLSLSVASSQPVIRYDVSFGNAVHYEATIVMSVSGVSDKPLELRMSRTSPGRYALHEFAKNVYSVSAEDGAGRPLSVSRPSPHQWDIAGHDGAVRVTYTVFGDRADGTYSGFDETHAHMNMPATFMWVRGLEEAPITVVFQVPEGSNWKVASQLYPTDDPFTYTSPDLQYFMDSPTELSDHTVREWTITDAALSYTMRLAMHHDGSDAEADVYAEMAKRLVEEARGVFGEIPTFETGRYTFIADYLPWVYGDGMEHRNSTILSSTRSLRSGANGHASTLIHEAFHAWNVERMRPASLEPFDFEEANMSAELWFAEGVTSYYDNLLMHRAGMTAIDRFASGVGSAVDAVVNSPGRSFDGAAGMSMKAPFNDAATSVDAQNTRNTFISYYTWGEAIGIGLDLTLRTAYPGKDLDGFMKLVWTRHGKTEVPYSNDDLEAILGEYAGDKAFAAAFFREHIHGGDVVDYASLLSRAGLQLQKRNPGKAGLGGVQVDYADGKAVIASQTLIGSPLYNAGIDRRDVIVSMDGAPTTKPEDYDEVLARHQPGDEIEIVVKKRGTEQKLMVVLDEKNSLEVVPFEAVGIEITPEISRVRSEWLDTKSSIRFEPLQKICSSCKRTYEFYMKFCSYDGEALPFADSEKEEGH